MSYNRQAVIELLEKALVAAKNSTTNVVEAGLFARQAAEEAGVPQTMLDLAHRVRGDGHTMEADLVTLAVDVATAAVTKQGEVYTNSLLSLHDMACERLDEIHNRQYDVENPTATNKTPISHLN